MHECIVVRFLDRNREQHDFLSKKRELEMEATRVKKATLDQHEQEMTRLRAMVDKKREELTLSREEFTGRIGQLQSELASERDKNIILGDRTQLSFFFSCLTSFGLCVSLSAPCLCINPSVHLFVRLLN